MSLQLTFVYNGVVAGSVFLLFATGFSLLYGTFRALNLASGAILTLGALIGVYCDKDLNMPLGVSIVAGATCSGIVTALMDALLLRPVTRRMLSSQQLDAEFAPMIVTISVGTIITGILTDLVGGNAYTFKHAMWFTASAFGIVSRLDILLLAIALIFVAGLYVVINRTRAGMIVRAVAEDRVMASAVGVRPGLVSLATFFASGAVTGVAGVLIGAQYGGVNVSIGDSYLLLAFVIATVGGLGSLVGTAIASIIIGVIQSVGGAHLSQPGVTLVLYGILLVTLVIRPSGLLGRKVTTQAVTRS